MKAMKKSLAGFSMLSILVLGVLSVFPQSSFAQITDPTSYDQAVFNNTTGNGGESMFGSSCPRPPANFKDFICISFNLVSLAIPYIAAGAVLAFIWGLSKIIYSSGNEERVAEGRMIIKWGVTGLFFLFSIWGALWVFSAAFGFKFGIPLLPV